MSSTSGWTMVLVTGGTGTESYSLTETGMQIGRSDECEVMLASQNVSRKHARVFLYQGRPYVQDLGSRNGVFVNGVRAQQQELLSGDTITLGEFVFKVASADEPLAGASGSGRGLLYSIAAIAIIGVIGGATYYKMSTQETTNAATSTSDQSESGQPSAVENMFESYNESGKTTRPSEPASGPGKRSSGAREGPGFLSGEQRNALVRDYLDRADLLHDAGRVTEALRQYELALKLDPACVLCQTRLERIQKEISAKINKHLEDGMKSFKALRYQDAINSWETVRNLVPDPGDPAHQQAESYIRDAEAKLASQQRF